MFFFVLFFFLLFVFFFFFFFSCRRRHTRWTGDWSPDVCSSDLRTCSFRRSRGDILTDAAQRGGRGDSLRSHEPDQRDWCYIKQRLVHRCGLTRWCLDGLSFQRGTTSRKAPASIKAWLRDTKRHACRVGMYSSKMHWPMPLIYINWSERNRVFAMSTSR